LLVLFWAFGRFAYKPNASDKIYVISTLIHLVWKNVICLTICS